MEFDFPFNFITGFLFLATLLTLFKEWNKSKKIKRSQKLPPGPWKLPLIGNLHQLIGSLPHHALTKLAQKHGPLMSVQLGEISAIVVSSPGMAKEVLKIHDLAFLDRPKSLVGEISCYNYTDMGMSPYGDYWKQMRKICFQELFSAKNVRSLVSIREKESSNLIESLQSSAGKKINLTETISAFTNSIVCTEVFGKVCRDQKAFIDVAKEVIAVTGGFDIADLFPSYKILRVFSGLKRELMKLHHKMDKMLEELIDEHVQNRFRTKVGHGESGKEDLIDVLLRIRETDNLQFPITNNYIKGILMDIFIAGTDSSSTTLDWAMAELMKNPVKMAKAQLEIREALKGKKKIDENDIQELKYLKLVVKETLRIHPPGPMLVPRACREDCEIEGYNIPVGTKLFVNAWAMARDPDYWKDPESFEPERFENSSLDYKGNHFEYIPFGAGRRMCPGLLLGIAHIELPLAMLLYHFNWKLPDGMNFSDLDMTESSGNVAFRKNQLHLIPTVYDPSTDMS